MFQLTSLRASTALLSLLAALAGCGDDDTPADTGTTDTGTTDTGTTDTGTTDTGGEDTGGEDTGGEDTGGEDTGGGDVVTLDLDNNGASDYNFVGEEPESGVIGAGEGDQTITLTLGQRYSIVVRNARPHPFEFITDGGSPSSDTVQLTQRTMAAALESDAEIDWDESVDGTVTFTVTATFMSMIDGYRCGIHVSNMRGAVAYE